VSTLDFFGEGVDQSLHGSLWLYRTTKGVHSMGRKHYGLDATEEALREYSGLPELIFVRETILDGVNVFASRAYAAKVNVAVITNSDGDILSRAPLPDDFRGNL
jgi:hypothetical protein